MESYNRNYIEEFDTLDEALDYLRETQETLRKSNRNITIEKTLIKKLENSKFSMVINIQYDEGK